MAKQIQPFFGQNQKLPAFHRPVGMGYENRRAELREEAVLDDAGDSANLFLHFARVDGRIPEAVENPVPVVGDDGTAFSDALAENAPRAETYKRFLDGNARRADYLDGKRKFRAERRDRFRLVGDDCV